MTLPLTPIIPESLTLAGAAEGSLAVSATKANMYVATKHVTSAQILNLFDTSVEILPAPGPGKVTLVINGFMVYRAGATPYTLPLGNEYLQVEMQPANALGFTNAAFGFLDSPVDLALVTPPEYTLEIHPPADIANLPLFLRITQGNVTDGDGVLDFVLYYLVADIS